MPKRSKHKVRRVVVLKEPSRPNPTPPPLEIDPAALELARVAHELRNVQVRVEDLNEELYSRISRFDKSTWGKIPFLSLWPFVSWRRMDLALIFLLCVNATSMNIAYFISANLFVRPVMIGLAQCLPQQIVGFVAVLMCDVMPVYSAALGTHKQLHSQVDMLVAHVNASLDNETLSYVTEPLEAMMFRRDFIDNAIVVATICFYACGYLNGTPARIVWLATALFIGIGTNDNDLAVQFGTLFLVLMEAPMKRTFDARHGWIIALLALIVALRIMSGIDPLDIPKMLKDVNTNTNMNTRDEMRRSTARPVPT